MMNKKAEEKYISIFWIFALTIIALGIFVAVWIFYSATIDVRKAEAQILTTRIADCLIDNGYLNEKILDDNFNLFLECNLNEKIIDKSGDFYIGVDIFYSDKSLLEKPIEKGIVDFKMQCLLKTEEEHLPECDEENIYALNKSNNSQKFLIKIISASDNLGASW